MKITDYVILFLFIILSFISVYNIKDNMAFQSIIHNEEMNRIIDNTTVYAFEKGYTENNNDKELINNQIVVETFISRLCQLLWGVDSEENKDELWDRILCMLIINEDGYYLCDKEGIGDKILFENIIHESKVYEIENVIEKCIREYDYNVYLPKNYGEKNSQTISDNSFLVVYRTQITSYFGEDYAECIMSGAAIKS